MDYIPRPDFMKPIYGTPEYEEWVARTNERIAEINSLTRRSTARQIDERRKRDQD